MSHMARFYDTTVCLYSCVLTCILQISIPSFAESFDSFKNSAVEGATDLCFSKFQLVIACENPSRIQVYSRVRLQPPPAAQRLRVSPSIRT